MRGIVDRIGRLSHPTDLLDDEALVAGLEEGAAGLAAVGIKLDAAREAADKLLLLVAPTMQQLAQLAKLHRKVDLGRCCRRYACVWSELTANVTGHPAPHPKPGRRTWRSGRQTAA